MTIRELLISTEFRLLREYVLVILLPTIHQVNIQYFCYTTLSHEDLLTQTTYYGLVQDFILERVKKFQMEIG